MTQQYQFFNRDLLEEACNLRLTGPKDLLHHFVKNNARNFEPDTTKDGILHKQSDNWRMANLRGFPGAKLARKAAQGKIGKRA